MPRTSLIAGPGGQRGFTLTELLVVIAIMAILLTIAAMNMTDYIRKSRLEEAARALDGDLVVMRNTARVQQVDNVVLVFTLNGGVLTGYRGFIDANASLTFDAGETILADRTFTNGVQMTVTSTGIPLAPVTTVQFRALGTIRDANRRITIILPSLPARQFMVTLFQTGATRVERSDDGGLTWPTRAW